MNLLGPLTHFYFFLETVLPLVIKHKWRVLHWKTSIALALFKYCQNVTDFRLEIAGGSFTFNSFKKTEEETVTRKYSRNWYQREPTFNQGCEHDCPHTESRATTT